MFFARSSESNERALETKKKWRRQPLMFQAADTATGRGRQTVPMTSDYVNIQSASSKAGDGDAGRDEGGGGIGKQTRRCQVIETNRTEAERSRKTRSSALSLSLSLVFLFSLSAFETTKQNQGLPSFTRRCRLAPRVAPSGNSVTCFSRFYRVVLDFVGFYRVFSQFYWVFLSFIGFY